MKLVSNQTAAIVAVLLVTLLIVVPKTIYIFGFTLVVLIVHDWISKINPPSLSPLEEEYIHDSSQLAVFMYMKHLYLGSPKWKAKRKNVHIAHNYRCDLCQSTYDLQVHHISGYCRIPNELPSDLTLLCDSCHLAQHSHHGYPKTYLAYMTWYAPLIKP